MGTIVTSKGVMPSLQCERSAILLCGIVLALASTVYAQSVSTTGEEYTLSGRRVGDQMLPQVVIGGGGGYLVWQDNAIDGAGKSYGIAARRLGSQLEPLVPVFRVNQRLDALQENPSIALMTNGGAAFVWQGGRLGNQDIFFRMYTPGNVLKPQKDLLVNNYTLGQQSAPVITSLSNGNFAVAWCSLHQDRHLEGVYARVVTPKAGFVGTQFQVNQFTGNNQRSPAITTLSNGHFVVTWVSENQGVTALETLRHTNRVHVYARVFTKGGYPVSDEFRVNTRSNVCAVPSVAPWGSRGFTIAWAERTDLQPNGWDICARTFNAAREPATEAILVNEVTYGDQFAPKIGHAGSEHLVVWTSLGHDGSREGVYARLLSSGAVSGPEFRVNTHTAASQIQPTVASDGQDSFLVAWSSFLGETSFDVRGQQYSATPPPAELSSEQQSTGGSGSQQSGSSSVTSPPTPGKIIGANAQTSNNLRVSLAKMDGDKRLTWTAEPGAVYQVQYSTNLVRWDNVGKPRTASSALETTPVGGADSSGYYRVVRVK